MSGAAGWEPATEAEVALYDALATGDQEGYFQALGRINLLLPVSADAAAGRSPIGWGTWTANNHTHLLAFTSDQSMRTCLAQHVGGARRMSLRDLAEIWPNNDWWLAVNPGLPIEGYLPAWFVAQLARGDARLPGQRSSMPRDRLERVQALERLKAAKAAALPREPIRTVATAGGPLALPPSTASPKWARGPSSIVDAEEITILPSRTPAEPFAPEPYQPPPSAPAAQPAPVAQPAPAAQPAPVAQPAQAAPAAPVWTSPTPPASPPAPPLRPRDVPAAAPQSPGSPLPSRTLYGTNAGRAGSVPTSAAPAAAASGGQQVRHERPPVPAAERPTVPAAERPAAERPAAERPAEPPEDRWAGLTESRWAALVEDRSGVEQPRQGQPERRTDSREERPAERRSLFEAERRSLFEEVRPAQPDRQLTQRFERRSLFGDQQATQRIDGRSAPGGEQATQRIDGGSVPGGEQATQRVERRSFFGEDQATQRVERRSSFFGEEVGQEQATQRLDVRSPSGDEQATQRVERTSMFGEVRPAPQPEERPRVSDEQPTMKMQRPVAQEEKPAGPEDRQGTRAEGPRHAEPEPAFVPANAVEEQLYEAAEAGNTDAFLSTLLLATVLIPKASGTTNGKWRPQPIDGEPHIVSYTSTQHLAEPLETIPIKFIKLISDWPDPNWSFAVNPGTPVGATLPGGQLLALANWAAEVGLGGDEEEQDIDEPSEKLNGTPVAGRVSAEVPVLQKAIAPSQVGYYLERGYDRVTGFVHRAHEVGHLKSASQMRAALGLDFEGSPFSIEADEIYLLRWSAHRPSLYRIPYGGQSESAMHAMQGWVIERAPFRGNGFAPGETSEVIAEFKVDSARLPHGARLMRLKDGAEEMVAIFDADTQKWLRTDGGS